MPAPVDNSGNRHALGASSIFSQTLTLVQVTRERDRGENVLAIRLRYHVIDRNVPGNNIVLAGLEQVVVA